MGYVNKILFCVILFSAIWLKTQAQVTKTINGTVSHESGMSKSTLTTNKGNVVVSLPGLQGKLITGTVTAEPAGRTEKEKKRNLEDLMKMAVVLSGQKIDVSASPQTFDWLVGENASSRTPLELQDETGEMLASVSLPPVLTAPTILYPGNTPLLTTPSAVLVKGDPLNIYTDQNFSSGRKFILTDSKGQQFILKPFAMSSQQAVMNIPDEASPGNYSISEQLTEQPSTNNNVSTKFKLVDFSLSSPNTNLRSGQTSSVSLAVKIQEGTDLDSNEFQAITVDVKNLTPSVVSMAGGNVQMISFPLNGNRVNPAGWQLTRSITGVKPGGFSVSATLHEDNNTSNEPFRPQINGLETPEEYASWVSVLKKDLLEYAAIQYNDETGKAIKSNTQSAIDNIPVSTSPELLDESKAIAYSLLYPVKVPKGAANTWLSSYQAFKSSLAKLSGTGQIAIDIPAYSNGLDFMERLSYKSNDPSMTEEITKARELINTMIENGETKEKVSGLKESLHSLSSKADTKLVGIPTNKIWNLKEVLFSTYCMKKRSKDGIDPIKSMIGYLDPDKKTLMVKPEYQEQVLRSLKAVSLNNNSYKIHSVSASFVPVSYNINIINWNMSIAYSGDLWAEELMGGMARDTSRGTRLTTHRDSSGTWYVFYKDARCVISRNASEDKCTKNVQSINGGPFLTSYITTTRNALSSCKKGRDFCTEIYVVNWVVHKYQDINCTRMIDVETIYGFSCW